MSQKKFIGRNVAIALGLVCMVLGLALVTAFAEYSSIINGKDSEIQELQANLDGNSMLLNQTQTWLDGNVTLLNQTQSWLDDNVTANNQLLELLSDNTTASYVVTQEGNIYNVTNANGETLSSSADANAAIHSAIAALTATRTWKEKITLKGDFVISGPIIVESYTILEFQGKVTVANNTDIGAAVKSEGFDSLQGTDSTGGVVDSEIDGLILDGNKAGQASCTGIELYGRRLVLRDVTVCNCTGDGIWTQWSDNATVSTPNDAMEGIFSDVRSCFNNGRGWLMLGPHDSYLDNILLYCNGGVGFASWGLQGGCQGVNLHAYGNSQAGFYINSPSTFNNIFSESNHQNGVIVLAHDVSLDGTFYNNGGSEIVMGDPTNPSAYTPSGCLIEGKALGNHTRDSGEAGLQLVNGSGNRYDLLMYENRTIRGTLNEADDYKIVNTIDTSFDGYRTQNSGNATIPNGSQTVVVNHGLVGTPRVVILTGTSSDTASVYVSAKNETSFTITIPGNVSGDREVNWYAED